MISVINKSPNSTYEIDDNIGVFPDDYQFGGRDLLNREVQDLGDISDEDINLLLMPDEQFENVYAVAQLPQFRSAIFKQGNMKQIKRRKYTGSTPILKANL